MLVGLTVGPAAGAESGSDSLAAAVQQLRDAVGEWSVVTEFLDDDGSVARTVNGTYRFQWVVEDRVLSGVSDIPDLKMKSGILFYVNEKNSIIEMVSVGTDGRLWVMTGRAGDEVRYSQKYTSTNGSDNQLRFTRFNVAADRFESKMEYTGDGKAWFPGNHQVFTRVK